MLTVEDLYTIHTYIYICEREDIYIYIYFSWNTNGGTVHEKMGISRQRRKPVRPAGGVPAGEGDQGGKRGAGHKKRTNKKEKIKRLSRVASSAGSLGLFLFFPSLQIPVALGFLLHVFLSPPPRSGLAGYSLNSYDYFRKR